jgi:hypothetical protein
MAYIGNSPANTGNYQLVDDISSSFNGSLVSFALASGGTAITPAKSGQILANINGVMQEPDDTGTDGFKVTGSNIVFSSAPASGDTFWAVYQGQNVDIGTPSDDVVDTAHIKDDAVTAAKLANSINTEIAANTAKTGITTAQASAITANTAKVTNSTSASDLTSGTLPIARIADGAVTAAKVAADVATQAELDTVSTVASAALPKAGGSLTGVVDWNNDSVYFRGNATHGYRFNSASDAANLVTIYDNGDTKVWAGDIYFGTAGKGIVLGATSNTAANTLDDYEEGTFTPTAVSGATSTTVTVNSAKYTKVGRIVHWAFYISGISGTASALQIGGLPFTCEKYNMQSNINSSASNATITNPHFRIPPNSTVMHALKHNDTVIAGNALDGSHIIVSGTYMTA